MALSRYRIVQLNNNRYALPLRHQVDHIIDVWRYVQTSGLSMIPITSKPPKSIWGRIKKLLGYT